MTPKESELKDRKARFFELNQFVTEQHGWLTSLPGDAEVEMQCLPGSTLPNDLRGLGYDVVETGETERILPAAITEMVITEGSTVPIRMTHAGICKVMRYGFTLP